MGQQGMDKPPTKAKPSAEPEDAPEQLAADIRRDVLRAAETCRERFKASPSLNAYQLGEILDALGRYPHLIDPVYTEIQAIQASRANASGEAVVTKIGNVEVMRWAQNEDGPMINKDGGPVWQRVQGRKWEGASMVAKTR